MNRLLLLTCCLMLCVCVPEYEARGQGSREEVTTEQDIPMCPDGFELFELSCYRLVSDSPIDGLTARTVCQGVVTRSHLVFIQSQSEQTFLQALTEGAGVDEDYWIGMTFTSDVDHTHWMDGTPLGNFTAWDSFGAFDESSPCIRLRRDSNYLWNDRPCTAYNFGYICEIESGAVDVLPLITPAPRPVPTVEAKTATFAAGPANMAAPTDNHLIQSMTSSLFRCASYCLKHDGCSSFNYQSSDSGGSWDTIIGFCELYSKEFLDNELIEKRGYRHYRL